MFVSINQGIAKKAALKKQPYQWAIAATILLFICSGLGLYFNYGEKQPQLSHLNQNSNHRQEVKNTSNSSMFLTFKDGTKVELYPHSQISYSKIVSINKREVQLTGKAFFTVAKDKKRPYTVISNQVSTTALGTQFMVDALKENATIRVALFEGRVVVKSRNTLLKKVNEPVYLDPNQEFIYEKRTGLIAQQNFKKTTEHLKDQSLIKESLVKHKNFNIYFVREPIEKVFSAVEQAYQVRLSYPKSELKDHYFSGSFNIKDDSLGRVLLILSETNKLNITKTKSGYKITKKH
ncbi:FecR family protein [Pedobacter sp. CG_S7]|uniref:FecR family protein n=1 Tax=Pedobacter sp. CG_S7 TaxID=3143930 RepID=UPI0033998911